MPADPVAVVERQLAAYNAHDLGAFVASPSVALFRVEIVRFFHVERFQEVREWRPVQ